MAEKNNKPEQAMPEGPGTTSGPNPGFADIPKDGDGAKNPAPGGKGGSFWDGVVNWWNDVTGATAQQEAENAMDEARSDADKATAALEAIQADETKRAEAAAAQQAQYEAATRAAMGGSVQDYIRNMMSSAQPGAEAEAQNIATQGTRQALMGARTAGLNRGQAALTAGRQAGDLYSGAYSGALERGKQLYQGATGQFAQLGQNQAGNVNAATGNRLGAANGAMGGAGLGLNAAAQMQANATQQATNFWTGAGNAASVVAGAVSDERLKDNITPAPDVNEIADAIEPVEFSYKWDSPDQRRVGVTAQDVENSPLAETVIDTPEGKVLDTAQLTPALLDMVVQLTKKVQDLEGRYAAGR